MKACPQCGSTYSDRIEFCFVDGVVLDVSAVAPSASDTADPWDVPSPASFDLPAPPPQVHRAALVPTPLAPFALPLKQVASPLNVAPPPPTAPAAPPPAAVAPVAAAVSGVSSPAQGTPSASPEVQTTPSVLPTAQAPNSGGAAAQPASAPANREGAATGTANDETKAVPAWVWWAGLGVAAVLLLAAMLFAAGSLGVLGAAATRSKNPQTAEASAQSELPPSVTSDVPAQRVVDPAADDERFPAEPLEIGVVAVDGPGAAPRALPSNNDPTEDDTTLVGSPVDPTPAGTTNPPTPFNNPDVPAGVPLVVGTLERPTSPPVQDPAVGDDPATPLTATDPEDAPASTDPTVAEPVEDPVEEEPPPPANAGTVMVFLQGEAEGLQLIVDGRLRRGTFPHTLRLAPGSHRFRVQDKSGKGYEIGQTIQFKGGKSARVMLIAP
ncbi:MAG: hypothetical protein AB8H79_11530 [Myxococcota bacterium]